MGEGKEMMKKIYIYTERAIYIYGLYLKEEENENEANKGKGSCLICNNKNN